MKPLTHILAAVALSGVIVGTAAFLKHRPDALPVRVRGVVLQDGRPLASMHVALLLGGAIAARTTTDARGRFRAELAAPGEYGAAVGTTPLLMAGQRDVTLTDGDNNVQVDLPPTSVEITVDASELDTLAQIIFRGPVSPTSSTSAGLWRLADGPVARFVGVGFGSYVITSAMPNGLVSREPAVLTLTPDVPHARVRLELARRPLALRVVDASGDAVVSATATAVRRELARTSPDLFDAGSVPPGEHVLVQAIGYLPVCVAASAAVGTQRVTLPAKGKESIRIALVNGPGRPVGVIDGLPGSDCPIGVTTLDLEVATDGASFLIQNVPRGGYGYRAEHQAPRTVFRVPGPAVEYEVPAFCKFCGS